MVLSLTLHRFGNNRREFFWMQEPDATKDDDIVNMVNREMNGPNGRGVSQAATAQTPAASSSRGPSFKTPAASS